MHYSNGDGFEIDWIKFSKFADVAELEIYHFYDCDSEMLLHKYVIGG
jgi:hypothetical protein